MLDRLRTEPTSVFTSYLGTGPSLFPCVGVSAQLSVCNTVIDIVLLSNQELANSTGGEAKMNEIANFRGGSKIGSSPPSCENKCYGCTPCEAIQVPTNTKKLNHFRVQYANYEPEGWKCKCGPSFYSPQTNLIPAISAP